MPDGMVWLKQVTTGERLVRWPVDARELIACGECVPDDESAAALATGIAAFPMQGTARSTIAVATAQAAAALAVPSTVLADLPGPGPKPKKGK